MYKQILEMCYHPDNGLYYFIRFIIGDLQEIGYPKPFRYNGLLRKWDKLIKSHKKLAILSARGHGKSVFFSEILNIYDMFCFKYRRILLFSASQEQANRILNEMKMIIDNNEWLETKKDKGRWATETIGYNKGYVLVKGIGSEILGEHVDRIVIDDILRQDNKISYQQIEDFIDMTLDPMLLNRRGQMIVVGTPKSESDIFMTIKRRIDDNPEECPWKLEKFRAIVDYEKKILQCPDRFTWKDIMGKRLSMGALKFAREYQLEFFSRDTSLFPERIIEPAKAKGKELSLMNVAERRSPVWTYVMGVDVARSGSVSADYTVAIVLAYNTVSQEKQIVHMWREKGLKITNQAYYIASIARNFDNCCVLVETNNFGQDMIDDLVDDYNVFVEPFTTGGKGQKKDELIRFLITSFEHEQITIPRGDEYTRQTMNILESELSKFCVTTTPAGNERFEGMGSHDDTVMALALANKATQISGVPFAVTSERENMQPGYTKGYESFLKGKSKETDLVRMINMGLIK